jgi:cell division protein FtsB
MNVNQNLEKRLLRIFIACEFLLFAFYYIRGANGLNTILQLKQENKKLTQNIDQIKQEISSMKIENENWEKYPWYREQIARQDLQMAYPDEEIFLIN